MQTSKNLVGMVLKCPQSVCESGLIKVVGQDTDAMYNPMRKPWFLQVREYKDGEAIGPWLPITQAEYEAWNGDSNRETDTDETQQGSACSQPVPIAEPEPDESAVR